MNISKFSVKVSDMIEWGDFEEVVHHDGRHADKKGVHFRVDSKPSDCSYKTIQRFRRATLKKEYADAGLSTPLPRRVRHSLTHPAITDLDNKTGISVCRRYFISDKEYLYDDWIDKCAELFYEFSIDCHSMEYKHPSGTRICLLQEIESDKFTHQYKVCDKKSCPLYKRNKQNQK